MAENPNQNQQNQHKPEKGQTQGVTPMRNPDVDGKDDPDRDGASQQRPRQDGLDVDTNKTPQTP